MRKSLDVINEVKIMLGKKKYCKNIRMYEVNLDKALELCYDGDKRDYVRHIGALIMTKEELKKFKEDDKFMNELDKELERLKADGCVVDDDTAKLLRTVKSVNFAKGENHGIEVGEERGIKSIIKNLLQNGMTIKDVIKLANADETMVKNIAKELTN